MRGGICLFAMACALVLGGAATGRAQLIYAVPGSNVVSVDPVTGTQVTRAAALTAHLGVSAIDVAGHRLFYEATAGSSNVLATFDLATNTTSQAPLSAPLAFMAFDPVTGRIFGARSDLVVSIDPSTGSESTVATISPAPYLSMGVLDVSGRKLYFFATGPMLTGTVLRTVNLNTGSVVDVPLPSSYGFVEWDSATGKLIAASGNAIVSIDPATGSQTLLAATPVVLFGYVSAFDPITRRLFFLGSVGASAYLVTFNLTTRTFSQTPFSDAAFLEYSFDVAAIPDLRLWSLVLLGATLVLIALSRFRVG